MSSKSPSQKNSFAVDFLKAFGEKPSRDFPEFKKLFGWDIHESVLPFMGPIMRDGIPEVMVLEFRADPWNKLKKLSAGGEQTIDFFLKDFGIYGLLLGLIPFAKYKGDVHFVDVSDGDTAGEVFLHNHEIALLEAARRSFPEFLLESYSDCVMDEDEDLWDKLSDMNATPKSNRKKISLIEERYQATYDLINLFRGNSKAFSEAKLPSKLKGVLTTHYELLVSSLTRDQERANLALKEAKKCKGVLTTALAKRVEENFKKPSSAKLGWLKLSSLPINKKIQAKPEVKQVR